jgi:hypothetical protein
VFSKTKNKMDASNNVVETVFQKIEDLASNQTEIIRLKVYSKSADLATFLTMKIIMLSVIGLFVFFLNIGLSLWLGDLLGKSYYGFFSLAIFYAVLAIFIRTSIYKSLELKINNLLLTKILKEENL